MAYELPPIRRVHGPRRRRSAEGVAAVDRLVVAIQELTAELRRTRESGGAATAEPLELVPCESDIAAAARAFERAGLRRSR